MATLAGCPKTFAKLAISFCWSENISVLAKPIFISFIYRNITMNI